MNKFFDEIFSLNDALALYDHILLPFCNKFALFLRNFWQFLPGLHKARPSAKELAKKIFNFNLTSHKFNAAVLGNMLPERESIFLSATPRERE